MGLEGYVAKFDITKWMKEVYGNFNSQIKVALTDHACSRFLERGANLSDLLTVEREDVINYLNYLNQKQKWLGRFFLYIMPEGDKYVVSEIANSDFNGAFIVYVFEDKKPWVAVTYRGNSNGLGTDAICFNKIVFLDGSKGHVPKVQPWQTAPMLAKVCP